MEIKLNLTIIELFNSNGMVYTLEITFNCCVTKKHFTISDKPRAPNPENSN